jgi:hypothetical protein
MAWRLCRRKLPIFCGNLARHGQRTRIDQRSGGTRLALLYCDSRLSPHPVASDAKVSHLMRPGRLALVSLGSGQGHAH